VSTVSAVIMAGGRGERFWPLGGEGLTKPFLPLLGSTTLIQDTFNRLRPMIALERIFVSIGEAHHEIARAQLPDLPSENFIVEPVGRDTAACIGLCALYLERKDPEGNLLAIPADHFISDSEAYRRTLDKGIGHLEKATGIVFGIKPSRPETGYGYIQTRRPETPATAWPVLSFVEKPNAATARRYVESGDFFWNSGIFLWKTRTLLELFRKHLPETYHGLSQIRPLLERDETYKERLRIFSSLARISIDYGIMEKTPGLLLIPAEFDWDDIGNWAALERALPADGSGNVFRGPHLTMNTSNCIVYSDAGVVATFGVSNLVVVQANGKVLVCAKDRAPELKNFISAEKV
jgi:mannose-1-phosphate guanylyltransferase